MLCYDCITHRLRRRSLIKKTWWFIQCSVDILINYHQTHYVQMSTHVTNVLWLSTITFLKKPYIVLFIHKHYNSTSLSHHVSLEENTKRNRNFWYFYYTQKKPGWMSTIIVIVNVYVIMINEGLSCYVRPVSEGVGGVMVSRHNYLRVRLVH